jgi:hypothetical protein
MHRERFVERIRESYDHAPAQTPVVVTFLGPARLDSWRLEGNLWSATRARRVGGDARVANIVRATGGEVWGALYEIAAELVTRSDGERSVVDRLEGHLTTRDPENYEKICLTVEFRGDLTKAWTYVGLQDAIERCEREYPGTGCDAAYVETVIGGAKSSGLPEEYIDSLRRTLVPRF